MMRKRLFKKVVLSSLIFSVFPHVVYGAYCRPNEVDFIAGGYAQLNQNNLSTFEGIVQGLSSFDAYVNKTREQIMNKLDTFDKRLLRQVKDTSSNHANSLVKFQKEISTALKIMTEAQIKTNIAIADYEEQQQRTEALNQLKRSYTQPITNCMQYGMSSVVTDVVDETKTNKFALTKSLDALNNKDRRTALEGTYEDIKKDYLKEGELKDADINASLLFGSLTGNKTRVSLNEEKAAQVFMKYLIGDDYIPTSIFSNKADTTSKQIFTDIQRRYATYIGLISKSLASISEGHSPKLEYLDFYHKSGIALSPQENEVGVSYSRVVNDYANKMMSSNVLKDVATAESEEQLLRLMNQTMSVKLLVSLNMMKSNERILAMDSAKLALLTEKNMGKLSFSERQKAVNDIGVKAKEK